MTRTSEIFSRKPDFEVDLKSTEGLLQYMSFYVNRAANVAGACMRDHVMNDDVVRDMHDIIGALSAAQSAVQLMQNRQAR